MRTKSPQRVPLWNTFPFLHQVSGETQQKSHQANLLERGPGSSIQPGSLSGGPVSRGIRMRIRARPSHTCTSQPPPAWLRSPWNAPHTAVHQAVPAHPSKLAQSQMVQSSLIFREKDASTAQLPRQGTSRSLCAPSRTVAAYVHLSSLPLAPSPGPPPEISHPGPLLHLPGGLFLLSHLPELGGPSPSPAFPPSQMEVSVHIAIIRVLISASSLPHTNPPRLVTKQSIRRLGCPGTRQDLPRWATVFWELSDTISSPDNHPQLWELGITKDANF